MNRLHLMGLLACLVIVAGASTSRSQTIISNVQIDAFTISPNGDGTQDTMTITYDLADTATAVIVMILEKDSVTVVDTLVSGVAQGPSSPHTAQWDGARAGGAPVPDDRYLVFIRAENTVAVDSTYRDIAVDRTTPQVAITNLVPALFAPGSPDASQLSKLTVDYDVFDTSPTQEVTIRVVIRDPFDNIVATLVDSMFAPVLSLSSAWDGSGAGPDGIHKLEIFATDAGGNAGGQFANINVDLDAPDASVTSLSGTGQNNMFKVVPDSLFGWAWDRNGIDSLFIRYEPTQPFALVQNTVLRMDTLFFEAVLADSISGDGTFDVAILAEDAGGRETIVSRMVTRDSQSPAAPTLTPLAATTRSPFVVIGGTVDADVARVRILRNGAQVDSVFVNLPGLDPFPDREVALVTGSNRFTGVSVDGAGNVSPPSAEVQIIFDDGSGLFITQPFHPNEAFQVNLSKPATRVILRIYDLGGQNVARLSSASAGVNITIPWDGRNGDGDEVKRGPLVAVAEVNFQGGGNRFLREIFLFDPE